MKKINSIQLILPVLISCLVLFCLNIAISTAQEGNTPTCANCDKGTLPTCSNSQTPKCPSGKGELSCQPVGETCTAVCLMSNSVDPDADFCEGSPSTNNSSGSISVSSSGNFVTAGLNPNFIGIWKGKNIRSNVNPNSLIGCTAILGCSPQKLHCKSNQILLPKICTKCESCINASRTIKLNLCSVNGQLTGSINHTGILNDGMIISQTLLTDNIVLLNIQNSDGGISTLTLTLTGNKKLSGTFSYGISFDATKTSFESSCL